MAKALAKTAIAPNAITFFGFSVTVGAAVLISTGHLYAAGFVVLAAGIFDLLDGAVARQTNRVTRFGAVFDSTLDRLSEAILILAIISVYARVPNVAGILVAGGAWIGSFMVSYIRARAEGAGYSCAVGFFTRPERVIVLSLGLLLSQFNNALFISLAVIAGFSFITAGHRLLHVWQQAELANRGGK